MEKNLIFDREISRMRWSPDRSKLAEDDVKVDVVTVKEGHVEVEMVDSIHTDYVRGLAWSGSDTPVQQEGVGIRVQLWVRGTFCQPPSLG